MASDAVLNLVIDLQDNASKGLDALKVGLLGAGVAVAGAMAGIGVAAFGVASDVQAATAEIQGELGVTGEEAAKLGDMALQVWGQNWGDSIGDAKNAIVEMKRQMQGLSDDELPGATEAAFALRDSFGVDIPEAANAANTLMSNFGLTSQQAFDFITKGFQSGLNSSGDFLDSVGEYSTQFANGGADAGQFFSLMESGLQGGMLGTDKAADAFKEFRLRISDGSKATEEALKRLNLSELNDELASGATDAATAFQIVQERISGIEDPAMRMQVATALIGTQFEDIGDAAFAALSLTSTSLDDMAGATDSLNARYATWPAMWEGVKRSALVALEPLGQQLLGLANEALPMVQSAMDTIIPVLTSLVNAGMLLFTGDFSGGIFGLQEDDPIIDLLFRIRETVIGLVDTLTAAFFPVVEQVAAILSGEGGPALDQWATTFKTAQETIGAVMDAIWTVISAILEQILAFWEANGDEIMAFVEETWQTIGEIVQVAMELINATIVPALQAIAAFISDHSEEIQSVLKGAWDIISNTIEGALGLIKGIITAALQLIQGDFSGAWDTIKETAAGFVENLVGVIEGAATLLKGAAQMGIDAITGVWDAFTGWAGIGGSVIDGIISGIGGAIGGLASAAANAAKSALDAAKNALGIGSPSKKFRDEVGKPITQGIAEGITSEASLIGDALSGLFDRGAIFGSLGSAAASMLGAGGDDAHVAGFEAQKKQLAFLQEQAKFITFAQSNGLDIRSILGGAALGRDADPAALLDAMSNAMGGLADQIDQQVRTFGGPAAGSGAAAFMGGGGGIGTMTVNVYGAAGQDVNTLAEAVIRRVQDKMDLRRR